MADKKVLEFDVIINDANKMTELAKNFENVLGKNLVKKIQEASKAVLEAESGTEKQQQEAAKLVDDLFPKVTEALISGLEGGAAAFAETIKNITEEIRNIEESRKEKARQVGIDKQSFETDEDTGEVRIRSEAKREEILNKQLDLLREQKIEQEGLDEAEAKRIPKAGAILDSQKKLIEGVKALNLENEEEIINKIKLNEFHELDSDLQRKIVDQIRGRISLDVAHAKHVEKSQAAQEAQTKNAIVLEKEIERVKSNQKALEDDVILKKEKQLELLNSIVDAEVTAQTTETDPEKQKQNLEIVEALGDLYGDLKPRIEDANNEQQNFNRGLQGTNGTFAKAAKQVFNYGIAFSFLRRVYRETLRTIRDLDKALTEMAIVTTMNREQAWRLTDTMSDLAKETGFTTTEIAKLSTVFFRQGRVLSEVIELTTVAAKAARIAGIDAIASADFLTSAINAFQLSAQQALDVSDRFAAIAAQSASSYEELAIGLSKFAAQANIAGVSIDFAMGLLAKGIETTREAPETIGTALKTVIARMRELTDLGKTFEDGMDISRVEMALRQVGIALRDEEGQFRSLELVLTELGNKWATLNTNQQASVAVALAGTRQQSRLIAIMQDFDRTLELVNISQDSAGATAAQHVQFMQGLEGATNRMTTAYQDFIRTISESEMIVSIVDLLTRTIENLSSGLQAISTNGRFWMGTIGLIIAGLKLNAFWVKANNAAKQKAIILQKMEAKDMKLSWWQKLRLAAAERTGTIEVNKNTAAKGKNTVGTAANTAGTNVSTVAVTKNSIAWAFLNKVMALNPAILLITVLAGVALWMGRSSNAVARNSKEIEENTKQIQANIFETGRTVRSVEQVIKKMEEFNDLPFLTPDQQEELENLNQQLRELFGEDANEFMAVRAVDETIDLVSQLAEAERYIHIQRQKQGQERLELVKELLNAEKALYDQRVEELKLDEPKWWEWLLSGFDESGTVTRDLLQRQAAVSAAIASLDIPNTQDAIKNNLRLFGDIFITELNLLFDESLSPVTEDAFRRLLEVFDFSEIDDDLLQTNLPQFVKENFSDIIPVLEEFSDAIDPSSSLLTRYQNFIKFFEQDIDEDMEDVLRRFIAPGLDYLSSKTPAFVQALENLGIVSDAQIQRLGSVFGDSFPEIIGVLETEVSRLQGLGVPRLQAQEIAWSNLIGTMEDATEAVRVYNAIFNTSFTDMANNLARFDSQLERTRDIQAQWMEGTLGVQDLAKFFEDNPQLFRDMEDVERFLSGESLRGSILAQRLEEEQRAFSRLFDAQRRYRQLLQEDDETDDQFQARKSAILAEIAAYRALTEFRGPLSQMTEAQFRFNAELERYNRLSDIGADTTEDLQRVISSQATLFEENAVRIDNSLANIEDRFAEQADTFGFGSKQITDFFQVIGGQVIPISENLVNIQGSALTFITELMEEFQENMDEAFDLFQQRRKFELDNEKRLLDEQKKVYEDYFNAIDRLEQQRDRSASREDLVNQLARLEGATDERSRRRALEIRRELNKLDEDDSRNLIQESRRALLETFDLAYKELEETWRAMTIEFLDALDGRGASMGAEFSKVINKEVDFSDMPGVGDLDPDTDPDDGDDADPADTLNSNIDRLEGSLSQFVLDLTEIFSRSDSPENNSTETQNQEGSRTTTTTTPQSSSIGGGGGGELQLATIMDAAPQNAKGGMVDYTGLSMLHGSPTNPEAVLSPSQTEMFLGLRNALEKISVNPNGTSGSVNIENISISTASLNNNQDFNRAGESLAESFRTAIQRKGITINTNKA